MSGGDEDALARIRRARAISGPAEARRLYARWASHYDSDVFDTAGVSGTARIASLLNSHMRPDGQVSILDAGCGTGALGALLHDAGFRHIDGIDISPEMLEIARGKGAYHALLEADLNLPFFPPQPGYDAVVSAGTFVHGHVDAQGFASLARLVAWDGLMVCAIADSVWVQDRFDRLLWELELETLSHGLEAVLPGGAADVHMLVAKRA